MKPGSLKLNSILLPAAALVLAGCWTPPNANVQPKRAAGPIQSRIVVQSVKDPATVQSIDAPNRSIVLLLGDGTTIATTLGVSVKNVAEILPGETVKATVTEELNVFVANPGEGAGARKAGAKVLLVDPSYRLLTLQYPSGESLTFKAPLDAQLREMAPGDDVTVQPKEVTALRVEKH